MHIQHQRWFVVAQVFLGMGIPNPLPPAGAGRSQSGVAKQLEFEAATIKPAPQTRDHKVGIQVFTGGRVILNGLPLKALIGAAFDVRFWQVSGGPDWIEKDSYDIEAVPPENQRAGLSTRHTLYGMDDPRLREMLQTLLTDRFGLTIHRETRPGKIFLLKVNKHARFRATRSKAEAASGFGSIGFAGKWVLDQTTMPQLANFASNFVFRSQVVDQTGLSGTFDYASQAEDGSEYNQDPAGSFERLIREMGLTLETGNAPVEILYLSPVSCILISQSQKLSFSTEIFYLSSFQHVKAPFLSPKTPNSIPPPFPRRYF